jgi:hypothetical protein
VPWEVPVPDRVLRSSDQWGSVYRDSLNVYAVACKSKGWSCQTQAGGSSVYAMGYPLRLLHFETQNNHILWLHQMANKYSATVLSRFFV